MIFISGGLVGRDDSGEGRRIALLNDEAGFVYVQTPMDRALGKVPTLRVVDKTLTDVEADLSAAGQFSVDVESVAHGPESRFALSIDMTEGDAGKGTLFGVVAPLKT